MPVLRAAALSDIGRVRRQNEDRVLCDTRALVFGVADGVGGLPGGAEAAELAVEEIARTFADKEDGNEPNLAQLVQRANASVARLGERLNPAMGIGTTLTLGHVVGSTMKLAHVGDSRCYVAHGQGFMRLTEDHSVENEARLRRARGEVVYYPESNRLALTRCVGQPGRVEVDVISRPLVAGDRYLFCTDGVTRMLPDSDLGQLVAQFDDPQKGVAEIVKAAVSRGGPDNATAVLVYVVEA